jgi:hypothetical protein
VAIPAVEAQLAAVAAPVVQKQSAMKKQSALGRKEIVNGKTW